VAKSTLSASTASESPIAPRASFTIESQSTQSMRPTRVFHFAYIHLRGLANWLCLAHLRPLRPRGLAIARFHCGSSVLAAHSHSAGRCTVRCFPFASIW
jgi:hypothetical protein